MYTGLSLSFCVRDIAQGLVLLEEVERITSGTAVGSPEAVDALIQFYKEIYWTKNPDECEHIARELFARDAVYQPRLDDKEPPNIAHGHWIKDGQQVRLR